MTSSNRTATILATMLMLSCVAPAEARTWRVALDGSGDTNSIHEAGQLATSGDTISIAVGRYSDLIDHNDGFTDRKVVTAFEEDKELTIIGDSRDGVIVGPLAFQYQPPDSPVALFWFSNSALKIANITFVNSYSGLRSEFSAVDIENCAFSGNRIGAISLGGGRVSIHGSYFEGRDDPSAATVDIAISAPGADSCIVDSCEFLDGGYVSFNNVTKGNIVNSTISGFYINVYLSSVVIEGCTVDGFIGINGTGTSGVIVRNSTIRSGQFDQAAISIDNPDSYMELTGTIVEGGTRNAIWPYSGASVSGSGNHILRRPGTYAVELYNYPSTSTAVVDLRNNFWGTTEADSVAAWIHDSHDADCDGLPNPPDICTEVLYLPIEPNPVPEEKTSLGGLKALFR